MGYLTNFRLTIIGKTNVDHSKELEEFTGYWIDDEWSEGYKWYDHKNDMKLHSSQYPDLLFVLEGIGEEHEDMWKEYYKNGKMQRCDAIITFEEFDESKLQ